MAERRMFAKSIIDSDMFLDMPLSAQALYFHLSMRADDDGFINNPKRVQRMIGANDDDFKLLIAKQFIIPFDSGIAVMKHWRLHNYIQKDRYKPTIYREEKAALSLADGVYTDCIHNVSNVDTQVRLEVGKSRDRLVCCTESKGEKFQQDVENPVETMLKTTENDKHNTHAYGKYKNVFLTPDQYLQLCRIYGRNTIDEYADRISCYIKSNNKKPYSNHFDTMTAWLKKDKVREQSDRRSFDLDAYMEYAKNTPLSERMEHGNEKK